MSEWRKNYYHTVVKERRKSPEWKEWRRWNTLKLRHGIIREKYEQMLKAQGHKCAICKEEFTKNPHVDHCHTTGNIRGLLCMGCNRGIGYLKDDPDVLRAAINYLTLARRE